MNRLASIATLLIFSTANTVRAQKPPLLPENDVAELANELSGDSAKRNLEGIARFHRQRGSQGFHGAAELVAERLRAYGLSDVAILQFPADGRIFYGTQRSRPAWDAQFGELSEVKRRVVQSKSDSTGRAEFGLDFSEEKLASYEAEPVVLAEDSQSADVTADLIDVGSGTKESDYSGKEVKGKLALVSAQPGAVQDLAVGKFGAAGIISYAQNQRTAWSGENQDAIRWGHLETFSPSKTFAFMLSLKTAHAFQSRLAAGEKITLHCVVKAGQHPGNYEVVTATIPGSDPKLKDEEIAFSCHLDHQRPGANDNASGCASILEVARSLQKLISEKKLAPPARTMRFVFPPEIEGTMALLNGKSEFAQHIEAVVHMDMVGGGSETKAVFHVTRGPMSLPSFVHDVAWAFADWLNGQSYQFAATGNAAYPMVAPEGGQEAFRAEYSTYTMGSDHDVYQDSSCAIPAIYLNDWPDRFIHTNFDSAANIDPTKLKRAAFIGAASGYYLARVKTENLQALLGVTGRNSALRLISKQKRAGEVSQRDACAIEEAFVQAEVGIRKSAADFLRTDLPKSNEYKLDGGHCSFSWPSSGNTVYRRNRSPKGPLTVFGYDYFTEHAKSAGILPPKLLDYQGLWGSGEEYAYEVLNFADGKRSTREIRDAVSAEYGPVPLDLVVEYLQGLEKIGVVEQVKEQPRQQSK